MVTVTLKTCKCKISLILPTRSTDTEWMNPGSNSWRPCPRPICIRHLFDGDDFTGQWWSMLSQAGADLAVLHIAIRHLAPVWGACPISTSKCTITKKEPKRCGHRRSISAVSPPTNTTLILGGFPDSFNQHLAKGRSTNKKRDYVGKFPKSLAQVAAFSRQQVLSNISDFKVSTKLSNCN